METEGARERCLRVGVGVEVGDSEDGLREQKD